MKNLIKADHQVGVTGKSFLQKSMPYLMKTLKYQGYVLSKDPKDQLTNSVDSTLSYYMPNFAEKVHKIEANTEFAFGNIAHMAANHLPLYMTGGYNAMLKGE